MLLYQRKITCQIALKQIRCNDETRTGELVYRGITKKPGHGIMSISGTFHSSPILQVVDK